MYNLLTIFGVKKLLGINEENIIEMETRYDTITKGLMILSNIQDMGRICVNENGSISLEIESKLTWIKRSITGDNRLQTIRAIKNVIKTTDEFIKDTIENKYLKRKEREELKSEHENNEYIKKLSELRCINNQLTSSKEGIIRLRLTTYKDDIPICSDVRIIENRIDTIKRLIKSKFDELSEEITN